MAGKTDDMHKLLETRRDIKRRKPHFHRQDSHKKKKVKKSWKKPRGLQSKMRLHKKGYRRSISVGFKSPVKVRGLMRDGKTLVQVNNVDELKNVDAKTQSVMIGSSVGVKKRVIIIKKALEKNMKILNYKDAKKYLESIELLLKQHKDAKKAKIEKKKKDTEKKEDKKGIEKLAQETKETNNEKKEDSEEDNTKKEKNKVLTKKGSEQY